MNNHLRLLNDPLSALKFTLMLGIFLFTGCSSRQLVPVSDGGLIDPRLQSIVKSDQGIAVTAQASAWEGEPYDLPDYVTPFYLVVKNDTDKAIIIDHNDFMLFDDNRTQYNPLPPDMVAETVRAGHRPAFGFRPFFSLGFGYGGFHRFSTFNTFFYDPFFYDPFYPGWYYPPAYYRDSLDDIFTQAFLPGVLQPRAKLEGFIYFKRIPEEAKLVTLEVVYRVQGEEKPHKLVFPFAVEVVKKGL